MPEYYESRAPRPDIDANRILRRPRSGRRPLPAGIQQREFSPPRALRNGQVQTMIGNLSHCLINNVTGLGSLVE